jgi:hypothetical protein
MIHPTMETEVISSSEDCGKTNMKRWSIFESPYKHQNPHDVLRRQEKEKRKKCLRPCLERRRSFVPLMVSTYGLIGREAKNLLKQIALRLTAKWEQPYSVVRGFVNKRASI